MGGGFSLSGEWVFASGVIAEGWFGLMAKVGVPQEDGSADPMLMLLPSGDFHIKDV